MFSCYSELRKNLDSGKITAKEIVNHYLSNIEKGKHLNAFLSVFKDEAFENAKRIDEKIKNKHAGKLAGMIIAIKDVLSIKDKKLTCASKILENFIALYTCTAVQRLLDEDAIIIGKTNCDEFAMGSSNENSAYGFVKNPIDQARVPGGSSGGSAVAVAADMCMSALGTDTGGSVRQPAAFCGVVGFKPNYGRVSRYGLTAFASSFDTIGTFTKNIPDSALLLEVIAGLDNCDSTSLNADLPKYSNELIIDGIEKKYKIGIIEEFLGNSLQQEIKDSIDRIMGFYENNGFSIKYVQLPNLKYSIQTYYILTTAEASSNLARYDGARYGIRAQDSEIVEDMYINSRTEGLGNEVKRRIVLGTYVLSSGYYDAFYRKAQVARRIIKNDFEKAFKEVDLIIAPTTPTTAFKIGDKIDDPLSMYLNDVFTVSTNLSANPAISIPIGKDDNGLPIGMQIIGRNLDELSVLRLADYTMQHY